jgi:hypothetical protein
MLSKMKYSIDKEKSLKHNVVYDSVYMDPYGVYSISFGKDKFDCRKTLLGSNIYYGGSISKTKYFDSIGARKAAYGTSSSKILSSLKGYKHDNKNIKGGEAIKIYRKRRKY